EFNLGTPDYPDCSTTLILQVDGFEAEINSILKGPGIKDTQEFGVKGLGNNFWEWQAINQNMFPLGLDVIFTSGHQVAALPRSVRVERIA
ncbi:MAG: phosphonate C-P lyase system protein PhnH, partial [Methyloligellaceae bacterium]